MDFRASLFISKRTRFTNGKKVFRVKSSRSRMVSRMRLVLAQILAHDWTRLAAPIPSSRRRIWHRRVAEAEGALVTDIEAKAAE